MLTVTSEEALFRDLYRIRKVEEELARVYPTDKIQSPMHLSIGQELTSVAVCRALAPGEKVFGTYRGHALYLAKGGDLNAFVAEMFGKATGATKGKGGSMHLSDPDAGVIACSAIVASTIPLAVGWALADSLAGEKTCTASFFGDGATEEGSFYESLNFALLHELRVLFVCENNFFAIHSPARARHGASIRERVEGLVDGRYARATLAVPGDVVELAAEMVEEVRLSAYGGPAFLEVEGPRWREHVGPGEDFDAGYRLAADVEDWKINDPVRWAALRLDPHRAAFLREEIDREVAEAFALADAAPEPASEELLKDVHA